MNEALDRLAETFGIESAYLSETGELRHTSEEAKRAVLLAMGIRIPEDGLAAEEPSGFVAAHEEPARVGGGARCFIPEWLLEGRVWGIGCQLYSLRSSRNHGIGDFEDLASLAELAAEFGADFVGVNPLHALFLADPARPSPYSPSSRRFLNPLYIALDRVEGFREVADIVHEPACRPMLESTDVDYPGVSRCKRRILEELFLVFCAGAEGVNNSAVAQFERFRKAHGASLTDFALFSALSEVMAAGGYTAGWHGWPEKYVKREGDAVAQFADEHRELVRLHEWMQWIARQQLAAAQERAHAAGMRIGLYLDLAVGVAPDGADTWADSTLVVPGARIGAPPDMFNARGQDWGLAPFSPVELANRNFEPFEAIIAASMRDAGAIRIDHVMGLSRLYWICGEADATDGAYVRYPLERLVASLARVSRETRSIVVGEDLGTVPDGLRELMLEAELQAYRVLFFERHPDGSFLEAAAYPREAMACITTHDLPTLRGWWEGVDIDIREALSMADAEASAAQREQRYRDRRLLLTALAGEGLLPDDLAGAAAGEMELPDRLPDLAASGIHRALARTPSRLMSVQLEDLLGTAEQPNLPGTLDEYPNWRTRLVVPLEEFGTLPLFTAICDGVSSERPRLP